MLLTVQPHGDWGHCYFHSFFYLRGQQQQQRKQQQQQQQRQKEREKQQQPLSVALTTTRHCIICKRSADVDAYIIDF